MIDLFAKYQHLIAWWFGRVGVYEPAWSARMAVFAPCMFFLAFVFWCWHYRRLLSKDLFNVLQVTLWSIGTMILSMGWPILIAVAFGVLPFVLVVWGVRKYDERERRVEEITARLTGEPSR